MYLKVPRCVQKFDPSMLRLGGHACTVRRSAPTSAPPTSEEPYAAGSTSSTSSHFLRDCSSWSHGGRLHRRWLPVRVPG
jgi:hypothetical protein